MGNPVISSNDAFWMVKKNPKDYPLMVFNPEYPEHEFVKIKKICHIYLIKYKRIEYTCILPNYYKANPNTLKGLTDKVEASKNKYIEQIYDCFVELDKYSCLQLFIPRISKQITQRSKRRYMTQTIRHKGKIRLGVFCLYMPEIIVTNPNADVIPVGIERS